VIVIPFLAMLVGCPDYGMHTPGENDVHQPILEVVPEEVWFPDAAYLASSEAALTLRNTGEARLEVYGLALEDASQFTVVDPGASALEPGEETGAALVFTARQAGPTTVRLAVSSSDPAAPTKEVPLHATGLVPSLAVDPPSLYLPDIPNGCAHVEEIRLQNVGTADLTLSDVRMAGAGFTVSNDPLPLVLPPDAGVVATVTFLAGDDPVVHGELWVTSDDPAGDAIVPVDATVWDPHHVDLFDAMAGDATDVLIYVDQSGSMDEDQRTLAQNFSVFGGTLGAFDEDYQVMVVTADNGCHSGAYLTEDTVDPEGTLLSLVFGAEGAWTEMGLTISDNALSSTNLAGCNAGFLRSDAAALILISDEPEQSPNSWDFYVADILTRVPGAIISAIAGPVEGGCSTAEPGQGYYQATQATGGTYLSSSDDGRIHVDDLSITAASAARAYPLTAEADPASLLVWVDEVAWTTGWTFDEARNSVIFDETALPPAGAVIRVEYDAPYTCD